MNWDATLQILWRVLAVAGLVFLNGFFVAAEFALVKIRDTQLKPLIQRGNRRAKVAESILQRLDSFLSAAQLGITLASLGLGWIGEPVFTAILRPVFGWLGIQSHETQHVTAIVVGFVAITFLHISAGEQAPKLMAIQKPLPTTLWVAYPMLWFFRISYPFVWMLNSVSQWLLRLAGLQTGNEAGKSHSEDELRLVFSGAPPRIGRGSLGRDIVLNALDLRRRVVREVMRPRQEMAVLDTEATISQCLEMADKTRYSRFPLCRSGDLDQTLGVVHIKDLYAMRLKARTGDDLAAVARKLVYVPETAHLEKLLQLFLDRKLHLGIVVDEYGGTMGMITLENILEELVGQIQDEFDQEKPLLLKKSDGTWEAAGSLPLHDLRELIGETLAEDDVTTTSGWLTQKLGGFPRAGNHVVVGPFELRVEEMDGPTVAKIRIVRLEPEESATPAEPKEGG